MRSHRVIKPRAEYRAEGITAQNQRISLLKGGGGASRIHRKKVFCTIPSSLFSILRDEKVLQQDFPAPNPSIASLRSVALANHCILHSVKGLAQNQDSPEDPTSIFPWFCTETQVCFIMNAIFLLHFSDGNGSNKSILPMCGRKIQVQHN